MARNWVNRYWYQVKSFMAKPALPPVAAPVIRFQESATPQAAPNPSVAYSLQLARTLRHGVWGFHQKSVKTNRAGRATACSLVSTAAPKRSSTGRTPGTGAGSSAGFAIKDFTWYQYLFTQFRAIFAYVFNFLLPVNL